jgi:WD40 repeat protein/serine/threonine protein kinase
MAATKTARDIFLDALDRAPKDRIAYLNEACGDDAALRQRVEALLRAHDDPGSFLSEVKPGGSEVERGRVKALLRANDAGPPSAPEATVDSAPGPAETADFADATACVGAILAGKYKLIEEIGEGGMGSVFMAQQTDPVKRAVAVKVIKAGMDSKAVLARFEAERQALAMMDHPNIAKVLDAGTTDGGCPFFVMELVKGTPITHYCDEHKLTPRQRLELFVPVCQAIQHAHQKGIIHRDIKPTNVLVAMYDDRPVPKVIDFGVAKAAGQALTDKTLMTGFGALVGTPEYMSPEQASLNNLDIDTRSDVYSLGVLLYELLTGTTPVDKKSLGKAALLEILRIVREVEAPRPSAKLSTIDTLPSVAANRGTEPAKLSSLMKGELDWLVMKSLEKDRTRRYETANALSRDIQRYLADEVVEARPPSVGYRVSKFVRRHKGQVLAASLVLLALVGGIAGTTLGLIGAENRRVEAERAQDAEAERVKERDAALGQAKDALASEAERVKERDRQLDNSSFLLAVAAYDNRDVTQARLRLDSIEAKHRGWEWHYLRRQAMGGIFTLYGHTNGVLSVAFSPDGTRIVTGSHDKTAKVWDARTGTLLLELKGHTASVYGVAFSPDGTRIVTGGGEWNHSGVAKVWDARTGTPQMELTGHKGGVSGVAFSPDGTRVVTGSGDKTAKVWDARTGTPQMELTGHKGGVTSVAFSPDGTRIVTGSADKTAKVWDAKTGTPELDLKEHALSVTSVAFSPDGTRIVTGSGDKTAKVWDARTGTQQLELKGHAGGPSGVAFSPDGTRIVTGGGINNKPGEAKVWDARNGALLLDLKGHTNEVTSVAFSPDGTRIVTGSFDKTAKVWDALTGTPQLELKAYTRDGSGLSEPNMVQSVAFSPDGTRIVTGSGDKKARVWDARTGTPQLELKGHTNMVWSVAFSPDGTRIVTGSLDNTAKVWDARTGMPLLELKEHPGEVLSVAFSPDGTRIFTGGQFSTAKVWDARTGTPQLELKGHTDNVTSVAFSPDGTRIVTGSWDKTAKVWDAKTGTPLLELIGHTKGVLSVAFSPDGTRIVTGSFDKTAKVWDAQTGTLQLTLKAHTEEGVWSVAFNPDGTRIVTGGQDTTAKVWDAKTGTPLQELKAHTSPVKSVAFSPDGTRIVTGSEDNTAKVWDARPGAAPMELKEHTGQVSSVAFSPDSTRIVTGSYGNNSAKVWDVRTGTPQLELKGHANSVIGVAFSPDGTRIVTVTGSQDQTAKVWDAQTGTPLLELKGETGRVWSVAFSPDGARIVIVSDPLIMKFPGPNVPEAKVWDARTGMELKGEPIPQTIANTTTSPDGRFFAHVDFDHVELIPLQPDEEELAYRRLYTQPNLWRYREGYDAARAAKDDFAAEFYFNLLPPAEQRIIEAQLAADREIAAGRTPDALGHLVIVSAANPDDTALALKLAALQAWFGDDKELADTCGRALESAKDTFDPMKWGQLVRICCLRPTSDKTRQEAALVLARKAPEFSKNVPFYELTVRPFYQFTLGLAEYRSGYFAEADAALLAAIRPGKGFRPVVQLGGDPRAVKYSPFTGTVEFFLAMTLFRQGKEDEARKLAAEAAAKMKPLPKDEKNPLADGASVDDLLLWLAYKEAKDLIKFEPAPAASEKK